MTTDQDREQAFVALYERFYEPVLAYARRRPSMSDALDVAATTFAVAWRRLDAATALGLPWLYRTAHLTLLNMGRSQRRSDRVVARLTSAPGDRLVADPAVQHAEEEWVAQGLALLGEADRELLFLVVWEQFDVRSAAQVVGCSPGAAAVRLHRARRGLARHLDANSIEGRTTPVAPFPEVAP
jgi:RNA polymerase sigma factor (sigma-70 family)